MSTVQNPARSKNHLGSIFHYGKECFLNRWQLFAYIGISLIFVPRLLAVLSFAQKTSLIAKKIEEGAISKGNLFDQVNALVGPHVPEIFIVNILSIFAMIIGVLTLAQLSRDYFEQNQTQSLITLVKNSLRIFAVKGFGVMLAMALILIPISMFSLLRVIVLCLLIMLPMELIAGHKGGFSSVFNCIFIKYVSPLPLTKWPTFSNMMTVGGLALTSIFLYELALSYALNADLYWGLNSMWWIEEVKLIGGGVISRGHLFVHVLELLGDSFILVVTMPFVASLRYHAQKHTFLISA